MAKKLTEDAVRDKARDILGFKDKDGVRSGVGQLTTFNQLGFAGVADKPDGWYLPDNHADTAIVLETKVLLVLSHGALKMPPSSIKKNLFYRDVIFIMWILGNIVLMYVDFLLHVCKP